MKAEVVRLVGHDPRDNPRFVVTNLPQPLHRVYGLYRERGDGENRLGELHCGLGFDRTSCTGFRANALRSSPARAHIAGIEPQARALKHMALKHCPLRSLAPEGKGILHW